MAEAVILLVEDDLALLEGMSDTLEMMGYRTIKASNGREGLSVLKDVKPDLIISDIMMPEMDGYEFHQAVSSQPDSAAIPFIFLTAKSDQTDVRRGLRDGVDAYLTKPFDLEDLLLNVQNKLNRFATIRKQTMSQLEELQNQIVTMFSHELRTPLTYIQGYTDLLADSPVETRPDELQMFLEGIQSGSRRLNMLVENLLMLVHLDTNVYAQEFQRFSIIEKNISSFIEIAASSLKSQAEKKNLLIKIESRGYIGPVRLVPDHMMVVLRNLFENAIKFTQAPGSTIHITTYQNNDRVFIDIADKGIGISPKDLPHLFDRFRQIDRAKHEQAGIGVGLSIARGLVQIQGGDIMVESDLGLGSTFTIWLPVYKGQDG